MSLLQVASYLLVCVLGTAVTLTRRPGNQILVYGAFGTSLALLFFVLHAPDVALSEAAVGSIALPVMVLVTMMKTADRP